MNPIDLIGQMGHVAHHLPLVAIHVGEIARPVIEHIVAIGSTIVHHVGNTLQSLNSLPPVASINQLTPIPPTPTTVVAEIKSQVGDPIVLAEGLGCIAILFFGGYIIEKINKAKGRV